MLRPLSRSPVTSCALVVALIAVLAALLAPELAPFSPDEQFFDGLSLEGAPLPPNGRFWLGTDLLGRDLLSRLIYGARTSLADRRGGERRRRPARHASSASRPACAGLARLPRSCA